MSIRTTVAGSWWPLPAFEKRLAQYHSCPEPDRDRSVLADAATVAIAEQRALGLDEWTGGEYFAHNFMWHLQGTLTGIDVVRREAEEVFDYDDVGQSRVVGPVLAPHGLGYASAFERENALPHGVPKATAVDPYDLAIGAGLMGELMADPSSTGLLRELTAIVNAELRGLAAAGCPHIQLDSPALAGMVNRGHMSGAAAAVVISDCFEGVKARKSVHFCNGNMMGRPASSILRAAPWVEILVHLDGVIDLAHLELKYFAQWEERQAFSDVPASIEIAAGIVDEANYWLEPLAKLKERTAGWARVLGEERLWLAPSCGFGRHAARDIPLLREKVERMVEAAATL